MQITTEVISPAPPSRFRSKWLKRLFREETIVAWIFIFPSLVGFITFYAVPAVRGLMVSFTDWDMLTPAKYVGLGNYVRMLHDADFWNALKVTSLFVLWNISIQTVLALLLGVIMSRLAKSNLVRSILLLPWLLSNVVVALLWMWLLDPTLGIVNVAIELLGMKSVAFLGLPQTAIPTLAIITIWRYLGYTGLLIFAGMQTIDLTLYEAAEVDGAGEWDMFWRITLPLMRPILTFVMVTSIIGSFQIFDIVAITTKGGPINATKVFNWLIYEQAFQRFNMGYAAALSVVLFLILIVVSFAQMRLFRANVVD
jgi:multiple sugar transport system permease protein